MGWWGVGAVAVMALLVIALVGRGVPVGEAPHGHKHEFRQIMIVSPD